jgi:DNA-binding response OmpR family regulator
MQKRILLIEDNTDVRELLARLLRMNGYEVTTAGGVEEALAAAADGMFDVILTDLGLPDGEAAEIVRAIAEKDAALNLHKTVRTIVLTGRDIRIDEPNDLPVGIDAVLMKPASIDQIIPVIEGQRRAGKALFPEMN